MGRSARARTCASDLGTSKKLSSRSRGTLKAEGRTYRLQSFCESGLIVVTSTRGNSAKTANPSPRLQPAIHGCANPFLVIDLLEMAAGKLEGTAVDGLRSLRKGHLDPENIGAGAKRRPLFQSFLEQIASLAEAPSEAFTRMFLQQADMGHVRGKALRAQGIKISQRQELVLGKSL